MELLNYLFCDMFRGILECYEWWMNVSKNEKWKHIKFQEISQFIHFVCQRFMVDTLKFRWRFNLRGMLSIAYINQTYSSHSVYYFLSGVPDYFYRNKISSGGDLSHYSSASLY